MIIKKIKSTLNNLANKYIYMKLCWGRTNSHLGIIMQIVERMALISIWLKLFNVDRYSVMITFVILLTIAMIILGHFDLKWKIMERETVLVNKHNPEIRELIKRVRK